MSRWLQFWFSPQAPDNLGFCRLLFFGWALIRYLPLDYRPLAFAPAALWFPIDLFHDLALPVLSEYGIGGLQMAWKIALFLSCAGILTRASSAVSFAIGAYLLGLPNNFGKTNHDDAAVILVMFLLAASRCGDAWSVDSLLRKRSRTPHGDYRWPIRGVQVLLALVFVGAGLSKLRNGGLYWFSADTLQILLLQHQHFHEPFTMSGLTLARHPVLCRLMATSSILIELAYPLALFSIRVRWLLIPASIAMLLAFRALLGPDFTSLIACSIFWVDWTTLLRRSETSP